MDWAPRQAKYHSGLLAVALAAATSATASFAVTPDGEPPRPDYNWEANHCEYYVDGLGVRTVRVWGSKTYSLLVRVVVDTEELVDRLHGTIERVGMLVNPGDPQSRQWTLGRRVGAGDYSITRPLPQTTDDGLEAFVLFVDVLRANGQVDRLWLSNGFSHFAWPAVFENFPQTKRHYADGSVVQWVREPSPIYAQRQACLQ